MRNPVEGSVYYFTTSSHGILGRQLLAEFPIRAAFYFTATCPDLPAPPASSTGPHGVSLHGHPSGREAANGTGLGREPPGARNAICSC